MALSTGLLVFHWMQPEINWYIFAAQMLVATTTFCIAHNHIHVNIWRNKFLNVLTDYWLVLFYGFPPFAWKPTHNLNHHRYNNGPEDYTKTYRFTEKNNLITLLTYPVVSAIYQNTPIRSYLKKMWQTKRSLFYYYISQYLVLAGYLAAVFYLDVTKALFLVLIPQQFALHYVLIINYVQHVHTDEKSEYNHSRNFVGLGGKLLLNNGFHTVHHEDMGMHWSKAPAAHDKIKHLVDPSLNERSLVWFLFRTYILGIFIPSFRTKSMRLERIEREQAAAAGK